MNRDKSMLLIVEERCKSKLTLWYLLLSAMHLIKQWLCQNCVWYLFTQRDASKLSLVSFNQRDASNGRTFNWKNCLWYLFLRAKYVFSIPFMSMMESTKVSAMLLMEEHLTENCLWYLFLRAKYCIFLFLLNI